MRWIPGDDATVGRLLDDGLERVRIWSFIWLLGNKVGNEVGEANSDGDLVVGDKIQKTASDSKVLILR